MKLSCTKIGSGLALILVSLTGSAFADFCLERGKCFEERQYEAGKVYLIGSKHNAVEQKDSSLLREQAIDGKLFLCEESVVRGREKDWYHLISDIQDLSHLRGLEDYHVEMATTVLEPYSVVANVALGTVPAEMYAEIVINGISNLCFVLSHKPNMVVLFKGFENSPERKEYTSDRQNRLYFKRLQRKMSKWSKIPPLKLIFGFASDKSIGGLDVLSDLPSWAEFHKYFGLYAARVCNEALPEAERIDMSRINSAIKNPTDPKSLYFMRFDVNVYWRGAFIGKNLKLVIDEAKKAGKPVFVVIGQDHYKQVSDFLEEENLAYEGDAIDTIYNEELARQVMARYGDEL